jgi:sulfur-carrier protein
MPVVWIPSLLRDVTCGEEKLQVVGATVQEVIANLEKAYPGIEERLCVDRKLRPNIAIVVDGDTSKLRLHQPLNETSELHFVQAMRGG